MPRCTILSLLCRAEKSFDRIVREHWWSTNVFGFFDHFNTYIVRFSAPTYMYLISTAKFTRTPPPACRQVMYRRPSKDAHHTNRPAQNRVVIPYKIHDLKTNRVDNTSFRNRTLNHTSKQPYHESPLPSTTRSYLKQIFS